jgi:hypothetical protein
MARGLGSTITTAISADEIIYADLLELHFPTPIFLTDAPHDMYLTTSTSGGDQSFAANGEWLGYSNVSETGVPRINSVSITLDGISTTFPNQFLNNPYVNTRAVIYRVFLNDDHSVIGSPVMIWDSEITSYNIQDSTQASQVTVITSSVFYDFEKTRGRRSNSASQQVLFPADRGFEFATVDVKDLRWGKKI